MFPKRYFNPQYWASRFWAKIGGESTEGPPSNFGVISKISDQFNGAISGIDALDSGLTSNIVQNFGVVSKINSSLNGVKSIIDNSDNGIVSLI